MSKVMNVQLSDLVRFNYCGRDTKGLVRRRKHTPSGVVFIVRPLGPAYENVIDVDITVHPAEINSVETHEQWITRWLDSRTIEWVLANVHRIGLHEVIEADVLIEVVTQYQKRAPSA